DIDRLLHPFPTRRSSDLGFAARFWNEYFKPIAEKLNATHMFRRPGANQNAELTADYLVDTKAWAVGSPATVADLIREQFELTGRSEEHTSELQSRVDIVC